MVPWHCATRGLEHHDEQAQCPRRAPALPVPPMVAIQEKPTLLASGAILKLAGHSDETSSGNFIDGKWGRIKMSSTVR